MTHARLITAMMAAAIVANTSACAPQRSEKRAPLAANPSAVIAAELNFARLAQEKGQWTAFRETMAKDAVMFVPQRVKASTWVGARADPAFTVKWQPHAVYVSCDGSAGVTTGAWQAEAGFTGYFTTVWLRQGDGSFRWVLDHGAALTAPRQAPEFIDGKQAACGARPSASISAGGVGDDLAVGLSRDQTLSWSSLVRADGSRMVTIRMWNGTMMAPVITDQVAAADASLIAAP